MGTPSLYGRKIHLRGSGHGNITENGRDDSQVWLAQPACRVRGPAPVTGDPEKVTCKYCKSKMRRF